METFATLRTTHTLANLANLDSLTKGFDIEAFYKEDLRLSEVLWLSQALSDEGKAILERKERPNLLAQLKYTKLRDWEKALAQRHQLMRKLCSIKWTHQSSKMLL